MRHWLIPALLALVLIGTCIKARADERNNPFSGARSIVIHMTKECPARHVLMMRIKRGYKKRCE